MNGGRWWQRGVIYQVYPRSFQDGDGDGVGDLGGLRARLDYLAWLGVDALWLSPIFPSPMADFGYDVADYTDIDAQFGTLDDLDALVADLHGRGMRLILDFVPNHTSDRHPWFLAARSSRADPHRDWYLWRDPAPGGGPPNNWAASFGGSAWTLDEASGQYYYHAFLPQQPDLNWRNPAVREAMGEVLRFWLRRGIDGFRIDVVWHLVKDLEWRDNPPNPAYESDRRGVNRFLQTYNTDRPEVHDVIAGLRSVVEEFEDRLLIGEVYLPLERLVTYYGNADRGLHLPFNFQLVLLPWTAQAVAETVGRYEALLPASGWPNWVLGNHDQPRVASRIGPAQARVAAMLLLTLRGTPTIYQGDELGLADVPIPPWLERDPAGLREPGFSRDPQRTPIPWDEGAGGGFTHGVPWLPLGPQPAPPVAVQRAAPGSMLHLHRELLALRRATPALQDGAYRDLGVAGDVLAYLRTSGRGRVLVALNLGSRSGPAPESVRGLSGRILVDSALARGGEAFDGSVPLGPDEGVVVDLGGADEEPR